MDAPDEPVEPLKVEPVELGPPKLETVGLDPLEPAPVEPDPVDGREVEPVEPLEPVEPVEEELCAARLRGSAAATETIRRWRSWEFINE